MVTHQRARTVGAFGAIADPTRRAILDLLRAGELSAGQLADRFDVSRPAVSKHIRVLHRAGLVTERREAQMRLYALDAQALAPVDAWLAPYRVFWAARLHDLKRVIEGDLSTPRRPRTRGTRRRP
jgi:DNA-binding transcriptional ArsR family regulator